MKLKKERCRKLVFTNVIVIICLCIINCATVYARMGGAEFKGYRNMKWPVPGYNNLSSCFFDEDAKTRGERSDYHYALDIATGGNKVNVVAAYEGTVVETVQNGRNDWGFGNQVIIRHNYTTRDGLTRTLYTHYSHLSSIGVSTNQQVSAGQYIGKTGGTASGGSPYGIHLDFQILTSANWRLYKTYSKDPFANEILELPSNLRKGGDTACCDNYISEVKQLYSKPISQPNNPFGYLDKVTVEMGKITVHGWAADMDAPNNPIDVHFYTVQNAQRVWLGAVTASEYRSDIRTSYPNINEFHGFTATFVTGLSGDVQVEAYGINVGNSGTNVMLWDSPKTVSVPRDTILPTISNVEISDISSSGYTVTCDVSDNIGLSSVQFPTWSHTNGQDDLVWHEGTISGNKATCRINVSDHKGYVNCTYQTDIYAYDKAGNCTTYINGLFPYVDATPPTISDVEIVDVSETGYTVECIVKDDHSQIDRVQFPTWFEDNNPFNADWSWETSSTYSGKLEDGKYIFRVDTSNYKNQMGKYHTDIYAWDEYGNRSECYGTETVVKKTHQHDYTATIKKTATCTEPGIMLYTCKDNDDSYEEEIPATGHQHTELRNEKEPTCAREGYTGDTYCTDCGTKLSSGKVLEKKPHTWDSGKITKEATCSEKGIKTYTCVKCNAIKQERLPETGHRNTEYRNIKPATCAETGYTGDLYCKDCNMMLRNGEKIEKKPHTWNDGTITTEATCTEKGIKTYTCTVCNEIKTEEIPATGHQHTELRNVKAATCAQEGYTGDTYCKDCNTKLASGKVIPKTEHTWDVGKITTVATCSGKGIKTYTCTGCNAIRTEEIPATGHQHTELRNVKAATCAQEGYTGDTYCKDCNTKVTAGKVLPKTDHTWDSGKITTAATCSGKGIKTYICTECNVTRTEEIPATGHQHTELRNAKVATCTQEGYTGDTYCKDCNTKLSSGKVLPKTDHTWDAGKITTVATCSEKGIRTFICTVCKSTRIEEIPATGHVNKITKFAKEASCKSEGYTGDIYCQDCGTLIEEGKVIPKADHVWNKGEITTPATCTTKGIKTYSCASCGTTKTEAIAATGHGATEIRNKKDATTTSEGYTGDTYCTICNQKISSGNTIAKLTPQTATPGKMIKDKSTNGVYKVLQDGVSVEFTKPVYKKVSVRIPDTIKVNGITCKVTGISANAFKNNKSLKSVTIGRNVTVIGTNAFYGCKKLSKVSGGNGIVKIGHRAFANCISLSKITIPGSVRSIGKQAFCNCKKLSSITINTSTLSGKTVSSKAFAGTYKKPTVKVPAKQMKAYKKLLKARGMSSKAVYRK